MRDRSSWPLGIVFVVAVVLLGGIRAPANSLDDLIAKHIQARGGLDALRAIKTLRLTGRLVFPEQGNELAYSQILKRPGKGRLEFSTQGMTGVRAWDGKEGWQITPFGGRRDPERTARDDSKDLIDAADIDGPLVDAEAKGSSLTYVGTEDVDGTEAHKIRVRQQDGDTLTVYLDPDYFLTIRTTYQHAVRGTETLSETDFGNYAKVDGVLIAHSYELGAPDAPRSQKIVIDKAEANVPADDALFAFPATSHQE